MDSFSEYKDKKVAYKQLEKDFRSVMNLIEASFEGDVKLLEELLERNVDINFQDKYGTTALSAAIQANKKPVLEFLLARGADTEIRDQIQNTAVFDAIEENNLEFLKSLLDHKAEINLTNKFGISPLMLAVENSRHEITRYLMEVGADANQTDKTGNTALNLLAAAEEGIKSDQDYLKSIQALLFGGANPNISNRDGMQPITSLCTNFAHGDFKPETLREALRSFLQAGADPNACDNWGTSCLSWALGDLEAVQLLLDAGADPEVKNCDGKTLLEEAQEDNLREVAGLIKKYQQK